MCVRPMIRYVTPCSNPSPGPATPCGCSTRRSCRARRSTSTSPTSGRCTTRSAAWSSAARRRSASRRRSGLYLGVRDFTDDDAQRLRATAGRGLRLPRHQPADRRQPLLGAGPHQGDRARARPREASPPCHVVRDMQDALLDDADDARRRRPPLPRDRRARAARLLEQIANRESQIRQSDPVLTHCNAGGLADRGLRHGPRPRLRRPRAGRAVPRLRRRDPPAAAGQPHHRVRAEAERHPRHASSATTWPPAVMAQGKVDAVIVGADRDRRQRRHRQQDRHARRRDPREALRRPVLRRRADSTIDRATPHRRRHPDRERDAPRGHAASATAPRRRTASTSTTPPSTSRRRS